MWESFVILVLASLVFAAPTVNTPKDYSPGVCLENAAIKAPWNCNGVDTYIGTEIFKTGHLNVDLCAAACTAKSAYNLRHPPAKGKPKTCQFFNTYLLYKNGVNVGQHCAMYSETWSKSYAKNTGYSQGRDKYTIGYSYSFSNAKDKGTPKCVSPISSAKSSTKASSSVKSSTKCLSTLKVSTSTRKSSTSSLKSSSRSSFLHTSKPCTTSLRTSTRSSSHASSVAMSSLISASSSAYGSLVSSSSLSSSVQSPSSSSTPGISSAVSSSAAYSQSTSSTGSETSPFSPGPAPTTSVSSDTPTPTPGPSTEATFTSSATPDSTSSSSLTDSSTSSPDSSSTTSATDLTSTLSSFTDSSAQTSTTGTESSSPTSTPEISTTSSSVDTSSASTDSSLTSTPVISSSSSSIDTASPSTTESSPTSTPEVSTTSSSLESSISASSTLENTTTSLSADVSSTSTTTSDSESIQSTTTFTDALTTSTAEPSAASSTVDITTVSSTSLPTPTPTWILNGGFESTDNGGYPWFVPDNSTTGCTWDIVESATDAVNGSHYARVTCTAAGQGIYILQPFNAIDVGATYVLSAWMRKLAVTADNGGVGCTVTIVGGPGLISSANLASGAAWVKQTNTWKATTSVGTGIALYCFRAANGGGPDGTPVYTYIDSIDMYRVPDRPDIVTNGDLEASPTNPAPWYVLSNSTGGTIAVAQTDDTNAAYSGSNYLAVSLPQSNTMIYVGLPIQITAPIRYQASFYVRSPSYAVVSPICRLYVSNDNYSRSQYISTNSITATLTWAGKTNIRFQADTWMTQMVFTCSRGSANPDAVGQYFIDDFVMSEYGPSS
ncbi:hypothetical protein BU16DRAFT_389552 [Lophium mytilinum]|uniref:CBM-cenC domain-containing protein n=1 Tax=Lophium mytilinum TaxID=390894 RepID=A0A6A6QSA3_9PEZI|nr:hypothetical protein BU16DRAFT_389552 [Lophium mytilinum]